MEVTRKQSAPNFRKNEHFLPNHIHTCVLISLHYLHIIRKSFLWLCSYFLHKIHCYAYSFIHPFKHSQLWSNATDLRLKDKSLFPSSHSTLALPGWPIILCVSLEDSFFFTFDIFHMSGKYCQFLGLWLYDSGGLTSFIFTFSDFSKEKYALYNEVSSSFKNPGPLQNTKK